MQQFEKTPFYLKASRGEKPDDLAHDHKKHSAQRINRDDIVRYLNDQATFDSLEGIKRHVKRMTTHPQEQPNTYDMEERFRVNTQVHTLRSGYVRTINRERPISSSAFLLMANCLNMLPAD